MISEVSIRNFQSLKKVDLELGPLTVIVGNSATGKSAFIRALKAVASNVRGTSLVTSGESALSVSVQAQAWKITLEKGSNTNSYRVCDLVKGSEKEYTKLAGEVPEEVTKLLGMEPVVEGRSVNFASEREQPYLLDESGQQVAKVLGDLTNVSTILQAVREANRRRNGHTAAVKAWNADLAVLQGKLPKFASLATRTALLGSAEQSLAAASALTQRVNDLEGSVHQLEYLERLSSSALPEIPDTSALSNLYADMQRLVKLAKDLTVAESSVKEARHTIFSCDDELTTAELHFNELLDELGECPTCHQRIETRSGVKP